MSVNLDELVHKLLVEQTPNMLDKTKCSTTAKHIYDYLTGIKQAIAYNNNLVDIRPNLSNLFPEMMRTSDERGTRVYYIHFDHITGETSHYFIIYQNADQFLVLQSAVFEFSIYNWLYPEKSIDECMDQNKTMLKRFDQIEDTPLDKIRAQFQIEQLNRVMDRECAIYKRIAACKYSGRKVLSLTQIEEFCEIMQQLEGDLTNVEQFCTNYATIFSCYLDRAVISSHLRLGSKDACFKYISSDISTSNM